MKNCNMSVQTYTHKNEKKIIEKNKIKNSFDFEYYQLTEM